MTQNAEFQILRTRCLKRMRFRVNFNRQKVQSFQENGIETLGYPQKTVDDLYRWGQYMSPCTFTIPQGYLRSLQGNSTLNLYRE